MLKKTSNFSSISNRSVAVLANRMVPDTTIFGSVCLDYESGVNIHAVENAVMLGAKVVWMPT